MNRHHARVLAFGLATFGCVGSVFGQATPNRRPAQTSESRGQTDGRQQPPQPVNNNAAQEAAGVMRRNGSSLLKATINARQDRSQARLADLSFHAVPEPIPRMLRKHDQVTIIVREQSDFSSKGRNEFKKQAEFDARLEEFVKLSVRNAEIEGGALGPNPPSIKASGKRDFKGEGTVDRSDSFTTRVQAEVVDVKPNGTLILQARSRIKTDDEERYFILTGSCRVEDVNADNTILSSQLFDKNIEHRSQGNVRNASKRGWLSNLLDVISPF